MIGVSTTTDPVAKPAMTDPTGTTTTTVDDDQVRTAIDVAADARQRAYAPYSDFRMGAGVVGADGRVAVYMGGGPSMIYGAEALAAFDALG